MSAIISIGLRLLPYLIFAGVLFGIGHSIFQSGVEREHNRVLAREAEVRQHEQIKLDKLKERIRQNEEAQRLTITEVQNNHAKEIDKLNDTVRKLSNRGLYVVADKCEAGGLPNTGKDQDPGKYVPGDSQRKIRLPEQIESDLWQQATDAGEIAALYNSCRAILLSPVCNIELID